MPAAIPLNAIIACQSLVTNQIQHSQFICQCPCFRFINPHQRGMDHKLFIHCQIQRHIQRLDKCVPAIGISAKVGLRNSRDQMTDTTFAGIHCCNTQKTGYVPGQMCWVRCLPVFPDPSPWQYQSMNYAPMSQ